MITAGNELLISPGIELPPAALDLGITANMGDFYVLNIPSYCQIQNLALSKSSSVLNVQINIGAYCSIKLINPPFRNIQVNVGIFSELEHMLPAELWESSCWVTLAKEANLIAAFYNTNVNGIFNYAVTMRNRSRVKFGGLIYIKDKNAGDLNLTVHHLESQTSSKILMRSLIADNACATVLGKIIVGANALESIAHLESHSLMLNDGAIAKNSPQLEIATDEVQCSHASSVGQIDQETLFYLRSRGLNFELARRLLINAFIKQVVDFIPQLSEPLQKLMGS